jgi:hypothetical protein
MFLLADQCETPPSLFTEMGELTRGEPAEWKETARWVKFEEDVEEGGNRWFAIFFFAIFCIFCANCKKFTFFFCFEL